MLKDTRHAFAAACQHSLVAVNAICHFFLLLRDDLQCIQLQ